MVQERQFKPNNGWMMLLVIIVMFVVAIAGMIIGISLESPVIILPAVFLIPIAVVLAIGFLAVAPNDARVLLLFGEYKGSIRHSGFSG